MIKSRYATFLVFWLLLASGAVAEIPRIIGTVRSDTINSLFGFQILGVGDQNNDGFTDFMTCDIRAKGFIFAGGETLNQTPFFVFADSVQCGGLANLGDINGDGFDEIAFNGRNPGDWRMEIYYGGPSLDTNRDLWLGLDTLRPVGPVVNGNDLNQNGMIEVISGESQGRKIILFELGADSDSVPDMTITPANFGPFDFSIMGRSITSGDFNGDDTTDLAINFAPLGDTISGQVYIYWGGQDFDTIPDLIFARPGPYDVNWGTNWGSVLLNLGDVNGDNYDDLYIQPGNSSDTLGFIYFGGPNIDTIPDVTLPDHTENAAALGDINNDGYNDLITSFDLESSSFSYVNVYYGGPQMDSVIDIRIDVKDMPEFLQLWGMAVAGVGDVDGDGFNDFAVAAGKDGQQRGVIYVFAGTDIVTDVEIIEDAPLPEQYQLDQNYPNPFNPETTIEFSLKSRSEVELVVFDILGRRVRTLIKNELSVGNYRVAWDGTDDNGQFIASGVYYYRLRTDEGVKSRKMMLLR